MEIHQGFPDQHMYALNWYLLTTSQDDPDPGDSFPRKLLCGKELVGLQIIAQPHIEFFRTALSYELASVQFNIYLNINSFLSPVKDNFCLIADYMLENQIL